MLTDAGRVGLAERIWLSDRASAALVTPDGTVDWWAPTRPGEAPVLSRLLDPAGAAVRVGPVRAASGARGTTPPGAQGYRVSTLVAETRIDAPAGRVLVVDALPWSGEGQRAPGRIVRLATALSGPVDVEVEVLPPAAEAAGGRVDAWSEGVSWPGVVVRCGIRPDSDPIDRDRPRWRAVRRLDAGESMVVTVDDPLAEGQGPLSVDAARRMLDDTAAAWRSAVGTLAHDGPARSHVERSALLVLGSSASGGPASAATTSLPRWVGGERNEEGRAVRLRHAAGAAASLAAVGLAEGAEAAEAWLRRAVEDAPVPWPASFDADGGPAPEEEPWPLPGWRRSEPVVAGVAADALDLDVVGDVLTAVSASRGGPGSSGGDGPLVGAMGALRAAADWTADHWEQPDDGVWARRGSRARSTASAVQAWAGLDALARWTRARNPLDLAVVAWHDAARDVLAWLEATCMTADPVLPAGPGGVGTDAALLRIAWRGPWPLAHPVVGATVDRVIDRLGSGALVHRLSEDVADGRSGPDNADVEASLWAVRALAALGRWEEAHDRFDRIVGLAGAGGLFGEAAEPRSGASLGNRPAVGAHLALIDAAVALTGGPH